MKNSAKSLFQPKTVCIIVAFFCSCVVMPVTGQDACQSECVKDLYARNCGGAYCITGVRSSREFESLCGNACISAISGGGMLDCLIAIGGSTSVQNNFVLNVQSFCANGDPFVPNTRGATTIPDAMPTVDAPPSDPSPSETTSPESSTAMESTGVDQINEEAPVSTPSVDPSISAPTPDPEEPSVVSPSLESPAHASEPAEVEPLLSEEAHIIAPASDVEVESHDTNSEGLASEVGPDSEPAPSNEPDAAPPSNEEPTNAPGSAPASQPLDPPEPASLTAVESSLPEFDPDDNTLENDAIRTIEEGFSVLDSDDGDGSPDLKDGGK